MKINVTYDASVSNAPAGFRTAVDAAVKFWEQTFGTPVTVNITIGWGNIAGSTIPDGALGVSTAAGYYALNYNEMRNALWQDARTPNALAAALALSNSDPTGDGTYYVGSAEAKALGLVAPNDTDTDGYIGLDAGTQYTFDPNNRAVPGLVDAIGVIEHEIGHILGRLSFQGELEPDGETLYGPIDLFRYSSSGVLAPSAADTSFSVDGKTLLMPFDNPSNGGTSSDWNASALGDVFCAFGDQDVQDQFSAADVSLMDVLGYHAKTVMPAAPLANIPTDFFSAEGADAAIAQGQNVYAAWMSGSQTVAGLKFTLTNNGTVFDAADAVRTQWFGADFLATFVNSATGIVTAQSTGDNGDTNAVIDSFGMLTKVVNAGVIQAVCSAQSLNAFAYGVRAYRNSNIQVVNQSSGAITVWSQGPAFGVLLGWGGSVDNAGTIDVTGSGYNSDIAGINPYAVGIYGANAVTNSGTIRATSFSNVPSIAVDLAQDTGNAIGQYVPPVLVNSGTIIGDDAIKVEGLEVGPFESWNTGSITNTGTIIGTLDLWYAKERVVNSGVIAGNIYFGNIDAYYDGSSGHLYGDVVLGLGANTVLLGNGGETVRGGGKNDTITGGSGNDFFDINRGNNTIDGGGGFNTLSLASAAMGYTVDLGAGTASGAGVTAIKNIQEVIGTDYNDTLKAGTAGAVLDGGAGSDTLIGGAGNDTLIAGPGGNDVITGGGGVDSMIYSAGDGLLTITDYAAGDKLEIYGYGAASSITQTGADVLITLSASDSILLKNSTAAAVSGLVYNSDPYPGLNATHTMAKFGSSTVAFNCNLPIYAGETIAMNLGSDHSGTAGLPANAYGFYIDGLYSLSDEPLLDNSGQVQITADSDALNGLACDSDNSGALTNRAGARLEAVNTGGSAILVDAGGYIGITNSGMLSVTASGEAQGDYNGTNAFSFANTSGAIFSVISQSDSAFGFLQSAATADNQQFSNAGTITITAAKDAYAASGFVFNKFSNTGSVTVTAGGVATGFDSEENFVNSGSIAVNGKSAIAIKNPWSVDNSGTITATSLAGSSPAEAIYTNGFNGGFKNSGTITADYALYCENVAPASSMTLTNSGIINGALQLSSGSYTINNTGTMHGDIHGGNGSLTFNSAGAHYTGTITIGKTSGNVTLGLDGAVVFGSGSSDTITGGAGDDIFEIAGGSNTINGGGGFNTLVLSGSPLGCTVNLATGVLSGLGNSTISNIQQVVGSTSDDILTAGATAATLIGGGGNDTLVGGAGNDTLVASNTTTTMTGGGGSNTFIYAEGDHQLVITDFSAAGNTLKIYGYAAASSVQQVGADTMITLSGTDTILLKNVLAIAIAPSQIVYSSSAYVGPTLPIAQPFQGNTTVTFNSPITIHNGQKLVFNGVSEGLDDASTSASAYLLSTLDDAGTVTVANSGDVIGLYCDDSGFYGYSGGPRPACRFTNEVGATFSVSSSSGAATGMYAEYLAPQLVNYGTFSVTAAGMAYGAKSAAYSYGTTPQMFNAAGGLWTVTSTGADALGMVETNGSDIENDGTLIVNAAANAAGFELVGSGADAINSGTITVTSAENWAFGVVFTGQEPHSVTHSFTNTGTITATIAIKDGCYPGTVYDFAGEAPSLDVVNSGVINGNVDFGGSSCTLRNTGVINGDILVHADDPADQQTSWVTWATDTIDLRGGTLNGAVVIKPGLCNNVTSMRATVYTGTSTMTVKIAGGESNLQVDINGDINGRTTLQYNEASSAASITHNANGTWTIAAGDEGTETVSDIQWVAFTDKTIHLVPGAGTTINWNTDPSTYITPIRDFDGNDLGGASSWKLIGTADVNGDGTAEHILFNRQIGRWAEVGTEADGETYFDNHGWGGDTRVVGIYIDPLVAQGIVVKGSDTDSQRRFQNDLYIDNIHGILGCGDYNHDGLEEVYFSLTDGTAYLHAYMHADGNIQYANYQNEQQVKDYLTTNGWSSSTWAGWFPSAQAPLAAVTGG